MARLVVGPWQKSLVRGGLGALAGFVLASLASFMIGAPPAHASVDLAEVKAYQETFGVSPAVAEDRLEVQSKGTEADVVGNLEESLGEDFAGVWFDNQKSEFVVPAAPGASRGAIGAELADARLGSDYRTAPVQSTWEELEAAQGALNGELASLLEANVVMTALDPRTNAVVVYQSSEASEAERLEIEALAQVPAVAVEIRELGADRFDYETTACNVQNHACGRPLRGGIKIRDTEFGVYICSSAFGAIGDTNGRRYLLTAGHCHNPELPSWRARDELLEDHLLGSVAQTEFSKTGDWAKIDITGSWWDSAPWPAEVAYWGGNQDYPINGEASSYLFQTVCHSGSTTGTHCGTVTGLDQTVDYGQNQIVEHLTRVWPMCIAVGDSGGSVFAANQALGIVSGSSVETECEKEMLYSEIKRATNALNAHIVPMYSIPKTTITQATALNGNPGWATIRGEVTSPGQTISNKKIYINLKRKEGGSYVYKAQLETTVMNNKFEFVDWNGVGTGEWIAKAIFPAQAPFGESESNEGSESKFTVKDGYRVISYVPGKCVDIAGGSLDNTATVHQWTCLDPNTTQNQIFTLVPTGDGYYQLKARHSGRCLDVVNAGTGDGAAIQQYTCGSQANQRWTVVGAGGEYAYLQAKHSNKCLDVPSGANVNGLALQQWTCNGSPQQRWKFASMDVTLIPTKVGITVPDGERLYGTPNGYATAYGYLQTGAYPMGGNTLKLSYYKENGSGNYEYKKAQNPTINSEGRYEQRYEGLGPGNWLVQAHFPGVNIPGVGNFAGSLSQGLQFHIGNGYRFVFRHSLKCLSLDGNKAAINGTVFLQWQCAASPTSTDGQVFTIHPIEGGVRFNITVNSTQANQKCLDITAGSQANGALLQQYDCNGSDQQRFQIVPVGSEGWQAMIAKHSGKCIDIAGKGEGNGAAAWQWDCTWAGNQQWAWGPVG